MRLPLKLNKQFWPFFLTRFIPAKQDPRILLSEQNHLDIKSFLRSFSDAISSFKFGTTFKTTSDKRHKRSDELLIRYFKETNTDLNTLCFLDIGASDGITSYNLMEKLNFVFKSYYLTDYNLSVKYIQTGKYLFFL